MTIYTPEQAQARRALIVAGQSGDDAVLRAAIASYRALFPQASVPSSPSFLVDDVVLRIVTNSPGIATRAIVGMVDVSRPRTEQALGRLSRRKQIVAVKRGRGRDTRLEWTATPHLALQAA